MNCPTEGLLRSYIDGELAAPESETMDGHLRSCAACRARAMAIESHAQRVREHLDAVLPDDEANDIVAVRALSRYRQAYGDRVESQAAGLDRIFAGWRRPAWSGLAVACILVLILSFSPGRSWAQRVLSMLRVQKVAVVPVNLSAITAEAGNGGPGKLIAQLISDNVVVTMKPGEPAPASSAGAASQMAGYSVRTLDGLGSQPQISVADEGAFHMTLDRDRIQAVLDQAGRSDIQIPATVDGNVVAVHIPRLVRQLYGSCPSSVKAGAAPGAAGPADIDPAGCIDFVQVPSPIVSVPPTLNIAALAEAGLQVTGMSAAEAHAFCQTVDWSSTLVIPVPQNGSSYRTVPVDGVNGTLVEIPPRGNFIGRYTLIWVKNGMVYSLGGKGTADRALAAAESLN